MNPPSAIQNAMGRERKPFTYTPGGLDLSEIKSERMARRLMRNAMNQGVSEVAVPSVQTSPGPSTPIVIPNFNCLPVQVFPSISLPSNPKSLLRTRSNPSQPQELVHERLPEQQQTVYNKSSSVVEPQQITNSNNFNFKPHFSYLNNGNNQDYFTQNDINLDNEFVNSVSETTSKEDNKKEVKVVKKQVRKEKKVEEIQNENNDSEAELTVKLTPKAAKTETSVEVVKKVGPGGEIEEVKTTTTKTILNGKTEIKTKTETKKIPAQAESEEEEVEEEEEEEITNKEERPQSETTLIVKQTSAASDEGEKDAILKHNEEHEITTTKKVVVVQSTTKKDESEDEVEEEEEEEEEVEQETKIIDEKPQTEKPQTEKPKPLPIKQETEEEEEDVEEEESEEEVQENDKKIEQEKSKTEPEKIVVKEPLSEKKQESENEEEEDDEEGDVEEVKEIKVEKSEVPPEPKKSEPEEEQEADEDEEEEEEEEEEDNKVEEKKIQEQNNEVVVEEKVQEKITLETEATKPLEKENYTQERIETKREDDQKECEPQDKCEKPTQKIEQTERKIPIFTESVESVEIKPIGPGHETISKSHLETTEIRSTVNENSGRPVSTQTELHRIENLVTVNRTTKTLDQTYEQITQHGIPTVKTYFAPSRDRVSTSPQPARPYQSSYTPESSTERRHSLLLERLSTERQIPPAESYHSTYQTGSSQSYETNQNQWSQKPQSEIVNVSNVKPSSITNQQWYQQSQKENVIYNNVINTTSEPTPAPPLHQQQQQQWNPTTYTDNYAQDYSKPSSTDFKQNSVPTYTPKPSTWGSNNLGQINTLPTINPPPNQYTFLNKDSTDSYQKSTQQYSSSYVPPPWEADNSYVTTDTSQNYYQPPPQSSTLSPSAAPGWKPNLPQTKFSKPAPTAYQPPKPNQSFVKPIVAQHPKIPGRKTYYSEYERRYISVPESTYVPGETKFQAQPDPSPQYYYDNNEPTEKVEHQWRRELREFTEQSSQSTYQVEESVVKPPWNEDLKHDKALTATYTPTPTWSQTLRPRSWRERSFESELNTQEWPRSNTLGRGRPVSSYVNTNKPSPIAEKPRGVSVDRYNPASYTSPLPAEHPPAQTYTLSPTPQAKMYHNPNVPAYHARASAEPREQPVAYPRTFREPRTSPIQSRSFKYLQWITGTED